MFRDGLLSPRSKLLPGGSTAPLSMYLDDDEPGAGNRANSVLSLASTGVFTLVSLRLLSAVLIPARRSRSWQHYDQIWHLPRPTRYTEEESQTSGSAAPSCRYGVNHWLGLE